jgi:hypothetical protein
MKVDIHLATALLHHTQLKERAIGVDFDSDLVIALHGMCEQLTLEEIVVKVLKVSLVQYLSEIRDESQELRNKKLRKKEYLKQADALIKKAQMAAAMLGQLNG